MSQISIRQSGGANIVTIPKAVLSSLGLTVGSHLDLRIKDSQIILTPINKELTLEALLEGSPQEKLASNSEELEWADEKSTGKELF